MSRLINEDDVINAIVQHTNVDGTLDEDVSDILNEIDTACDVNKIISTIKHRCKLLHLDAIQIDFIIG